MSNVQSGILPEGSGFGLFLGMTFNGRVDWHEARRRLADIPNRIDAMGQRFPEAAVSGTVAVGSEVWDQLYPNHRPQKLTSFPAMKNDEIEAPHTPMDLLLHLRSSGFDVNFELGLELVGHLAGCASVTEEVQGFRYLDSRDLTGFVDGTENPTGKHRAEVALVGSEDPSFQGGSYVHVQRYIHDLNAWNQLAGIDQERAFGRSKAENIEFKRAEKGSRAHTLRTSIKDAEGRSIEILRHSMPYGNTTESGLFFIAYAKDSEPFTEILKSMVEGDSSGRSDHILTFTRPVTGAAFFAPSREFLEQST